MAEYSRFLGLDVHKDTIAIAVAEGGRGEARFLGRIINDRSALARWLRDKRRRWGRLDDVFMCYEAGPCGYGLYRFLRDRGHTCVVVAPGLTPRKPNDPIKTDRRDALKLASYLRAGELTPVWVPSEEHEAFRQLLRFRAGAVHDRTRARHRLTKFLLSLDRRPPEGVRNWTHRHAEWLASQKFTYDHHQIVFVEMQHHIRECSERLERLDRAVSEAIKGHPLEPAIRALECLKGFQEVGAATVCAEVGDIARFYKAPELMSYTGLVPGVASSGDHTTLYGITKVGNAHLRRILVEAAWAYRYRPNIGPVLARRQRGQHPDILGVSWRAQTRLNDRYRHLLHHRKDVRKVITAVARELVGFVWEVLQYVPAAPAPLAA